MKDRFPALLPRSQRYRRGAECGRRLQRMKQNQLRLTKGICGL
jgi:hypothetical protein